jgi:hypothetical protein
MFRFALLPITCERYAVFKPFLSIFFAFPRGVTLKADKISRSLDKAASAIPGVKQDFRKLRRMEDARLTIRVVSLSRQNRDYQGFFWQKADTCPRFFVNTQAKKARTLKNYIFKDLRSVRIRGAPLYVKGVF